MKKKARILKGNEKGFTLVEILVVLVILAILAAALVPALIGFVNEAKGKAYVQEARTAYVAVQAKVTENVAVTADYYTNVDAGDTNLAAFKAELDSADNPVCNMMKDSYTEGAEITDVVLDAEGAKVTKLVYTVSGKEITIEPGKTATVK